MVDVDLVVSGQLNPRKNYSPLNISPATSMESKGRESGVEQKETEKMVKEKKGVGLYKQVKPNKRQEALY